VSRHRCLARGRLDRNSPDIDVPHRAQDGRAATTASASAKKIPMENVTNHTMDGNDGNRVAVDLLPLLAFESPTAIPRSVDVGRGCGRQTRHADRSGSSERSIGERSPQPCVSPFPRQAHRHADGERQDT
jgi:hypothetical protein